MLVGDGVDCLDRPDIKLDANRFKYLIRGLSI